MISLANLRDTLAERLTFYRDQRRWTQYDLAAATEMSISGIRGYEQKRRWPDPEEIASLAAALEVNPTDLLTDPHDLPEPAADQIVEIVRTALKAHNFRSPAKRRLVDLLPSLDDSQAARYASLMETELAARAGQPDRSAVLKHKPNKAR